MFSSPSQLIARCREAASRCRALNHSRIFMRDPANPEVSACRVEVRVRHLRLSAWSLREFVASDCGLEPSTIDSLFTFSRIEHVAGLA